MDVRITHRRALAGDTFARLAEERARKLERFEPRLQSVDIKVGEDRSRTVIEVRAEVAGAPAVVASSDGDSNRAALDRALQKVRRQLSRQRSKRVDHQAPPAAAVAPDTVALAEE
jgi:ribosomal subunit interface protein